MLVLVQQYRNTNMAICFTFWEILSWIIFIDFLNCIVTTKCSYPSCFFSAYHITDHHNIRSLHEDHEQRAMCTWVNQHVQCSRTLYHSLITMFSATWFGILACMTFHSYHVKMYVEVTDDQVVRAGISVTWNVLSWSGGHEFEPRSGCLGCMVFLS